jgi:hypothetical protein
LNRWRQYLADLFPKSEMGIRVRRSIAGIDNDKLGADPESSPGDVGSWGDDQAGPQHDKEITLPGMFVRLAPLIIYFIISR